MTRKCASPPPKGDGGFSASAFFGGNMASSRLLLHEHDFMPKMISKCRLNRRLHAIPLSHWDAYLRSWPRCSRRATPPGKRGGLLPHPYVNNIRIGAPSLRGRKSSGMSPPERYFYGLRVHMLVTAEDGKPGRVLPGSRRNQRQRPLRGFELDCPPEASSTPSKQYNDYHYEDLLEEAALIEMRPLHQKNSKRPLPLSSSTSSEMRKRIETSFSQIVICLPEIHAVTASGFELKIVCSFWRCLSGPIGSNLGYLTSWLADSIKEPSAAPRTRLQTGCSPPHHPPNLGGASSKELTPGDIRCLYRKMAESGLKDRSIEYVHTTLRKSLKAAAIDRLINHNPTDGVKPLKTPAGAAKRVQGTRLLSG